MTIYFLEAKGFGLLGMDGQGAGLRLDRNLGAENAEVAPRGLERAESYEFVS
jgi:hypothetical protein